MKLFKIVTLLAFAAAVVGCEKEMAPIVPELELTDTRIEVIAGITSDEAMGKTRTTPTGETFKVDAVIGLYAVANYKPEAPGKWENDGNFVDDAKFSLGEETWTTSVPLFYPKAKLNFFAYAPYLEDVGVSTFVSAADKAAYPVTIPPDQNTVAIIFNTDFMTAQTLQKGTGDGTDGATNALALKFHHRLAKLDISFTLPETYKGKTVSGVKSIEIKGVKSEAVIDMTTEYTYKWDETNSTYNVEGGVSPKPAVAKDPSAVITITPNLTSGTPATDGVYRYEAIVVPQTFLESHALIELVISYTAEGGTEGGTEIFYYQVGETALTLHAAKNTVLNLTIGGQTSLELGAITIEPWGTALDVDAPTTKLSNMFFSCEAGADGTINESFVSAVLTINDGTEVPKTFKSTSVTYDGTTKKYKIQYDHGTSMGGDLTGIVFENGEGTESTPAVSIPEGRSGFQIKGNPTLDDYSTVIAKLTFNASSAITLTADTPPSGL